MATTKRAKKITVKWVRKTSVVYSDQYQCPSCRRFYVGAINNTRVIKFTCECGQDLIIDQHLMVKESEAYV